MWAYGQQAAKLFDYRVHLGTNIPDIDVCALPTPNRIMLTKRLMRHSRNALFVAQRLQTWISDHPSSPFEAISFPGLLDAARANQFYGSYLTVGFKKKFRTVPIYKRFVKLCMSYAKAYRADLVCGSTFGTNITRVYLTAMRSVPNAPFIRIAVGTEDRQSIETISEVFVQTLAHFR